MNRMTCKLLFSLLRAGLVCLAVGGLFGAWSDSNPSSGDEAPEPPEPERKEVRLTLEECLRHALKENLSLSAEALNIAIAEQGVVSAQAPFDSQLGLDALYEKARSRQEATRNDRGRIGLSWSKRIRTGQVFRVSHSASRFDRDVDVPISPFYDLDWTISAVQPLAKGAGRTANMAPVWIARNEEKRTVLLTSELIMNLVETVEAAYLDLIYAIGFLDVQQSGLKLAKELLDRNETFVKLGKLPERSIEVLEAKASIAAREEGVIIALNGIAKAEDAIRRLMNLPVQFEEDRPRLVPADEPMVALEFPKVEESLSLVLAHRPQVQAIKLDLDNARLELAAAKNNRLPEVNLRADLGLAGSDEHYGSSFEEIAEGDDYVWQAGISVSIPWGNRAARSRYERAKLSYQKAKIIFNDFLEQLRLEVINAHRDLDRDIKRVASTKAALKQADLQLQAENERRKEGMSDSFRILEFQDDLIAAQIRHLAATVDLNRSYFNLLRVEGRAIRNERFDLTDTVQKALPVVYSSFRKLLSEKDFAR